MKCTPMHRFALLASLTLCCIAGIAIADEDTADEDTIGSRDGELFMQEIPAGSRVTDIRVFFDGDGINGIRVHYQRPDGLFNMLPLVGSATGQEHSHSLAEDDEIISIGGTLDAHSRIHSITINSRHGTSGAIGATTADSEFLFVVPEGSVFTGLKGAADHRLTRIGITYTQSGGPVEKIAAAPPPPATKPVLSGWTITTRDFICTSNGSESDSIAEVFGDLTLAFDAGRGTEMAFLLARGAAVHSITMDCNRHIPVSHPGFTHAALNVPAGGSTGGHVWFMAHLQEADAGNLFDPHDDLGEYETTLIPLPLNADGVSVPVHFTGPKPGDTGLRITLDITPQFTAAAVPDAPQRLRLTPAG